MKTIYGIGNLKRPFRNAALSIGVFDGVHLGHQALIKRTVRRARALKGDAVVMTFDPHPVQVLHPQQYVPLISTLEHRLSLIERLGVDACIVIRFTKQFARLSPEGFVKKYLMEYIRPREIFVGCDFLFGNHRRGDLNVFKECGQKYGFQLNVVHSIEQHEEKISSTQIRQSIHEGRLSQAAALLGRPFSVMGIVQKGQSRGTHLGFPTANVYPQNEILPPNGVYAVRVEAGSRIYDGMANVGTRPTFNSKDASVNIEVHLFRFRKDIVGQNIVIVFVRKIRDERSFESEEALTAQLREDQRKVSRFFSE
jgi:riboflavin kinase/FMN adenylyltransferase